MQCSAEFTVNATFIETIVGELQTEVPTFPMMQKFNVFKDKSKVDTFITSLLIYTNLNQHFNIICQLRFSKTSFQANCNIKLVKTSQDF